MSDKKQDGPLVIGGEPRIDFLPLEVKQRKANRKSRRSLVMLVILVVVVSVAGYVYSAGAAVQSQAQLDEARARTQFLLQEQGQYAIARTTATEIDAAEGAALVGTAPEILWKGYLAELRSKMPSGTKIVMFSIDGLSAIEFDPVITVPLEKPRAVTITFKATTPSLARANQMVENLETLTGYADAAATTLVTTETGTDDYLVDVILHITSDAYERRLFPEIEDPDAGTDPVSETSTTDSVEDEG